MDMVNLIEHKIGTPGSPHSFILIIKAGFSLNSFELDYDVYLIFPYIEHTPDFSDNLPDSAL